MNFFKRMWPKTLFWQIALVIITSVLVAQVAANLLWGWQTRSNAYNDAEALATQLGEAATNSVEYFKSLPASYRPLAMEQMRTAGGSRFFVTLNKHAIANDPLADSLFQQVFSQRIAQMFKQSYGLAPLEIGFYHPEQLVVDDKNTKLIELPENWQQFSVLLEPKAAPVLVMQYPLDEQQWIFLATLLPDPFLLDKQAVYQMDMLVAQIATIISLLMVCVLVVRRITRPLKQLAFAADQFGKGLEVEALPPSNSLEIHSTTEAFVQMRDRIQRYLDDRQKLFAAISHDLRTPITRLKLRTEFIQDEQLIAKFHQDLDELDLMVKGALQSVKDTQIHENPIELDLSKWLARLVEGFNINTQKVRLHATPCMHAIKPLAMKRAISNIIDNGIKYGDRVDVSLKHYSHTVEIQIKDEGPGVDDAALESLFSPYVRLEHGKQQNQEGHGLGLSISQNIIHAHGGDIYAQNGENGGLVFTIMLPKQVVANN